MKAILSVPYQTVSTHELSKPARVKRIIIEVDAHPCTVTNVEIRQAGLQINLFTGVFEDCGAAQNINGRVVLNVVSAP